MQNEDIKNPGHLRKDSLYMRLLKSPSPDKKVRTANFAHDEFDSPETRDIKRLCAENEALKESIARQRQLGSAGAPLSSIPGENSGDNSVINPYRVNMYSKTDDSPEPASPEKEPEEDEEAEEVY
jgi:hypothetical protein